MPRRKRNRRIQVPPVIKGMSVFGVRGRKSNEVYLLIEEYEAIRLLDYQGLTQEEAAVHMDISRPTLTRIYEEARNKVATSFVEGRDIIIRGGDIYFDKNWFKCNSCQASFNHYSENDHDCPVCGSKDIISLNEHYSS
ncbi:MAG: DUF134 domain-containing protein [Prolixibacteraceae bacterium]|jgi:uncharacterized protein|nr:DUF134 domain-containing protein [Prolixibacteraceae bacterium]MBT6006645.1 DUF134 domain-containing protein [Prolixibacteraceae bacterium]MBT6767249.1 DUF134 domain-containing protein [Prolixibacteraceae bacterium]MBT6999625.1 DUF134 domain-containing protein [Prolixibacteraceae bacterium]MBT7393439.1 DUF134 domain-containing protein [Prolixibacteraceae bacterium]